jgi:hypothetical protein
MFKAIASWENSVLEAHSNLLKSNSEAMAGYILSLKNSSSKFDSRFS